MSKILDLVDMLIGGALQGNLYTDESPYRTMISSQKVPPNAYNGAPPVQANDLNFPGPNAHAHKDIKTAIPQRPMHDTQGGFTSGGGQTPGSKRVSIYAGSKFSPGSPPPRLSAQASPYTDEPFINAQGFTPDTIRSRIYVGSRFTPGTVIPRATEQASPYNDTHFTNLPEGSTPSMLRAAIYQSKWTGGSPPPTLADQASPYSNVPFTTQRQGVPEIIRSKIYGQGPRPPNLTTQASPYEGPAFIDGEGGTPAAVRQSIYLDSKFTPASAPPSVLEQQASRMANEPVGTSPVPSNHGGFAQVDTDVGNRGLITTAARNEIYNNPVLGPLMDLADFHEQATMPATPVFTAGQRKEDSSYPVRSPVAAGPTQKVGDRVVNEFANSPERPLNFRDSSDAPPRNSLVASDHPQKFGWNASGNEPTAQRRGNIKDNL